MSDSSYVMEVLRNHVVINHQALLVGVMGRRTEGQIFVLCDLAGFDYANPIVTLKYILNKKVIVTTITLGGAVYLCYRVCRKSPTPALPQLDLDHWWGPEGTKNGQDKSIRSFKVEFSEEMVRDLRLRLSQRRALPPPLEGVGFRYGFNSNYLARVLDYWRDSYNFHEREAFLNRFPHFKTNVQGLDMHYIHVKPSVDSRVAVLPLLLLHGWPGSVREFYEVIPLLTTPSKDRDFVFEVIVSSLPGYGFSSAAVRPGLGTVEIAVVIRNLMHRIGLKIFYIQGGDVGAGVGSNLATLFPDEVLGFHSNMMSVHSPSNSLKWLLGSIHTSCVVEDKFKDRLYPISKIFTFIMEEFGYAHIQATKPDTVGVGLSDSPAGLAAYILEKFSTFTNTNFRDLPDGGLTESYQLVDLLDNIMIYWSTNCITTSVRLYAEVMSSRCRKQRMDEIPTPVPTWALKTKYEVFYQPDSFIRSKFVNLLGSTTKEDGGHFAALELPSLLAEEVFSAVKKFREFHLTKTID